MVTPQYQESICAACITLVDSSRLAGDGWLCRPAAFPFEQCCTQALAMEH